MNTNFNHQYSARHRIFFAIHTKQNDNNKQSTKQQIIDESAKNKPVCFWSDDEYISER